MSEHTFTLWLRSEVIASQCVLLSLYEQMDTLQYIEGPRLEREYMKAIGSYEEEVIRQEIECELLEKKQRMIQAAINRKEPIDEAAIDAEIDQERERLYQEAVGDTERQDYAELSAEQFDAMQELYREIVKEFHPQMHPEITEVQKILFQKAQEAYRRRDKKALELIYDLLQSSKNEEGAAITLTVSLKVSSADAEEEKPEEINQTDYTLAKQIYHSFLSTQEEAVLCEEWAEYKQKVDMVLQEMEEIRAEFPYTAADMLEDPAKIEEYKKELEHRLYTAKEEYARRTEEIRTMIERVTVNE
mgnify:CR=1 FL=1